MLKTKRNSDRKNLAALGVFSHIFFEKNTNYRLTTVHLLSGGIYYMGWLTLSYYVCVWCRNLVAIYPLPITFFCCKQLSHPWEPNIYNGRILSTLLSDSNALYIKVLKTCNLPVSVTVVSRAGNCFAPVEEEHIIGATFTQVAVVIVTKQINIYKITNIPSLVGWGYYALINGHNLI